MAIEPPVSDRRARVRRVLQPLPAAVAVAWLASGSGLPPSARAELAPERGLVAALAERGVTLGEGDVHWIDPVQGGLGARWRDVRALIRASTGGDPADVWLVVVRLSPEARLAEVRGLYNLTETSAVEERDLTVVGERAAWTLGGGGRVYSVHYASLAGAPLPADWSALPRWQARITQLQETGQSSGVLRRAFKLDPAPEEVRLSFGERTLEIDADARAIRVPTSGDGAITGERFVREEPSEVARPGNVVTWAVDRARALPWFGSDRMQAVKAIAFTGLDWVQRFMGKVTGDDGSQQVAAELGALSDAPPAAYTDPETGWPPAPLEPMLKPALAGEGQWRVLDGDPFIRTNPAAPAPFATTFIRTDHERAYSQIWITAWDPRQVSLHAMSGTVEPKSATGETGPGLVPRDPAVMQRLLGAFNGGFQATHGEFGMMADGVVYLPPKPYAASVAELRDGSTAFGTWPNDETVPDDVVSLRQNMTPLVLDGTINPYKRDWWGGVPPGWTDESRTTRSAVCLTKENFVAYLYGSSVDADRLALAMQRARCVYGIHLDMNAGHTGLEFYRVGTPSEVPPLERKLDAQWEAEGDVSDAPGLRFRGRRMLRYMGLMNFPRYIQREGRDFFYLTLRHVLPGPEVASAVVPPEAGEGTWTVQGLPQFGWPYALATTELRPDAARVETKVRLLQIDPRWSRVTPSATEDAERTLLSWAPTAQGEVGLWLDQGRPGQGTTPPAGATVLGRGHAADVAKAAAAALGISRTTGMIVYAEVASARVPAADVALLVATLARLGVSEPVLLDQPLMIGLGGQRDLGGHPLRHGAGELRFVRREGPGARRIFADTPIVPVKEWYPLQAKRIRYFKKPKPAGSAAPREGADPPAPPDPAPAPAPSQ